MASDAGPQAPAGAQIPAGIEGVKTVTVADPNLGAFRDNGGLTRTLAPNPGSPAVDAGAVGIAVMFEAVSKAWQQSELEPA